MGILATQSTNPVQVFPYGTVMMAFDGLALLSDTFDGSTIDTTTRWNSPVLAGGGTVTQSAGDLLISTGTTASNAGALTSQEVFSRQGFGWLKLGIGGHMDAPPVLNTNRFWGLGTPNASFTAATPIADGVGFEVDIFGALNCCIYAGNSKVFNKALNVPGDGGDHAYVMHIRDDAVFWFLDNLENPVASTQWNTPNTSSLPVRLHMINHTTGPAAAPTFHFHGLGVSDSSMSVPNVFNGQTVSRARTPNKFIPLSAVVVTTETTIWTPASGRRFRLMGYNLTQGVATGNVTLKDNTGGATILTIPASPVGTPFNSPPMGNGILSAAANNVLTATGASTETISGFLIGCEE